MMAAIVRNLGVDRQFFLSSMKAILKSIGTYLNLGVNCERKARQRLRSIYRIQRCWSGFSVRKFASAKRPRCLASYARNAVPVLAAAA
jgi:hypothetical protein